MGGGVRAVLMRAYNKKTFRMKPFVAPNKIISVISSVQNFQRDAEKTEKKIYRRKTRKKFEGIKFTPITRLNIRVLSL